MKQNSIIFMSACHFLGLCAEFQKAFIGFILSLCLSIHMEQLGSCWTDFHEIWYLSVFWRSVKKIQVSLKSDKNYGYFTWILWYVYDSIWLIASWNEKCFQQKLYTKSKTHFIFNKFVKKSCFLWDSVEKYGCAIEATDDNIIQQNISFACWIPKAQNM